MGTTEMLASGHVPVVYLIEAQFVSGTLRLNTWGHALDWMGATWAGLNCVSSLSTISDGEALAYPALEIGLSIANPGLLALALGNAADYRRRPITVWEAVLDDELRPQDTPELCWAGLMDQVRVKTGDGEKTAGSVVLRCELPGRDSRAAQGLRLNHAQQQERHPGDTGLSRIEQLTGQPRTWLSKKFQKL